MANNIHDASVDRMYELSYLIAQELRKETNPLARAHHITGLILGLLGEQRGTPDQMCDTAISSLWLALLNHPARAREDDKTDTQTIIDELMTNAIQRHTAGSRAVKAKHPG